MRNHKDIAMLLLLSNRVDPNQSTEENWTTLFYVPYRGYPDITEYFTRIGANVLHRANDGRSAEGIARAAGDANPHRSSLNAQALLEPFFPNARGEAAITEAANRYATIETPSADAFVPTPSALEYREALDLPCLSEEDQSGGGRNSVSTLQAY